MDPEEQQPQDWRELLIQLSRAYQASAPTEAQRGYVSPIERIFDPQIAALTGASSPDTRLSEDDLYDQFTDFRYYLEGDPASLDFKVAAAIYNGASRQEVNQLINDNYLADIDRRTKAGDIDPTKLPTKKDYIDLSKTLYDDQKEVAKKMAEQDKAFKESNPFFKAGLPEPTQQYTPEELGQIFPEQFKTIQQRLEQRLPLPTMPKFAKEQFTPYGPSIEVSKAAGQTAKQKADVEKRRQEVQNELNKIIQQKATQAGFTPFFLEAARRLSVGR